MRVHVAVINLLCRKGRRGRILRLVAALRQAAEKTGFPIESVHLVEAVDGVRQSFSQLRERYGLKPFENWAISDPESKFPSSWRVSQTSGGIASGLSHLDVALLGSSFAGPNDYVLVLEDDCYVTQETAYEYFVICLEEANRTYPDWDILLLGAGGHRPDIASAKPISGADNIEVAGFSYLTTMYWLSQRGLKKLVNNRPVCVSNCLAFDELHNALAGLSNRPDVNSVFANCERIVMLSSLQQLVKQDPHDGVHDTVVIASDSRRYEAEEDVAPPTIGVGCSNTGLEAMTPFVLDIDNLKISVTWHRRRVKPGIPYEVLMKDLGLSKQKLLKRRPQVPIPEPLAETQNTPVQIVNEPPKPLKPFGLVAALMKAKREQAGPTKGSLFPASFDWYEKRALIRD